MDRTWGAVGSGRLAQELRNLPAGNYELKVAAQNIQEDTPSTAQTGAWIFAETSQLATLNSSLQQTTVTVRDNYTVAFNYVAGSVTIGFEAKDVSGNWIAVDNFRLIRVGDNLTAELNEAVEKADAAYSNATGKEAQQLLDAIAGAKAVAAKTDATGEEQAAAIVAMEKAIDIYRRANASSENPLDMTYSSGISTQKTQSPQSAQNFHLMRGRVDVDGHRGYYIIHPESSANPPCLYATTNGKTGTAAWNIAKSAKTQRWLILTAEEAQNFDNGNIDQARAGLADMLARIRKLAKTPHTEDVANADDIYSAYSKGTAKVTTSLYINSTATAVKHICDDRQPNALFNDGGWGSDKQMSDGTYIPNCMTGAEKYFAKGLYDSSVSALLDKAGSSLRIGIKCSSAPTYYWSMFDHFRLHFFGGNDGSEAVGIHAIGNGTTDNAVYSLSGQRQQGMQRGLNIVIENGVVRKVLRK